MWNPETKTVVLGSLVRVLQTLRGPVTHVFSQATLGLQSFVQLGLQKLGFLGNRDVAADAIVGKNSYKTTT